MLITDAELLLLGATAGTLSDIPVLTRDSVRNAASSIALSYLRKRYGLPLVSWSDDVKAAVADIAAYRLLRIRGVNPANGRDLVAKEANDAAIQWLGDIARGIVEPEMVVDSTVSTEEHAPLIATNALRGWGVDEYGTERLP